MSRVANSFEYDELVRYLRGFETWDDRGGFDFGGIVGLLGACLDCIAAKAQSQEISDIAEHLTDRQVKALRVLAASASKSNNS
jgi:hypothetical protein